MRRGPEQMSTLEHAWALSSACKRGELDAVQSLLDRGADPTGGTTRLRRPLHIAAEQGHLSLVRLLLAAGADPNQPEGGASLKQDGLPLGLAVENGHLAVVSCLLEAGAAVNALGSCWESALTKACKADQLEAAILLTAHGADIHCEAGLQGGPLSIACRHGHTRMVDFLLEQGCRPPAQDVGDSGPVFSLLQGYGSIEQEQQILQRLLSAAAAVRARDVLWACRFKPPTLLTLLLQHGVDVHGRSRTGAGALHWACEGRNEENIALLLSAGVDPCSTDEDGRTPMHVAAENASLSTAAFEQLLAAGAVLDARDHAGRTPVMAALSYAWRTGAAACAARVMFLLERGARAEDAYLQPAVRMGQLSLVERLLALGASPSPGADLVWWAAHDGHAHLLATLKAAGADLNAPIHGGDTPIHVAVKEEHADVVDALLRLGASLWVADSADRPPLFYATGDLRQRLLQRGEVPSEYQALLEPEAPPGLACADRSASSRRSCDACGWRAGEEALRCPWCHRQGIENTDYRVLHGNPEVPTADTEVEFTYTCSHCKAVFWNSWNAFNTASPVLFWTAGGCYFRSSDWGETWRCCWSPV